MKFRRLLLAWCALMIAPSLLAQQPADVAERIAGTWIGQMGQNDTVLAPITVELKFDGTAISGSITGPPNPAEITGGTFDPQTGALRLDVVVKDTANTRVVFEGTVMQGTATGRVKVGDQLGHFKITKGSAGAGATPPSGGEATAAARKSFGEVNGWVTKAAELVPTEKYTYRPAPSVRTYGQLIAHLADAYTYYCSRAAGRAVQWSDAIEKGNTDKATVVPRLKQAADACMPQYDGSGQIGPLIENVGHTNLHYGNIVTYVRMLGLVPPSSGQ